MSSKNQVLGENDFKTKEKKSQRRLRTNLSPKIYMKESLKKSVRK